MTEQLQQPDPLSEVEMHGRTLRQWHDYLMRDGNLRVPCSRYGTDTEDCVPYALACELIYIEANGENSDEGPGSALEWYMSLVVNDDSGVLDLVRSHWYAVPEQLRLYLGYEDAGLNMNQQAALSALCARYGTEYKAEHYTPQFDLPPDYVAGWIGNEAGRYLYVGCDGEGQISS